MSPEAKVKGPLGHAHKVKGVSMEERDLDDLKISHLQVNHRVELVIVESLDLLITE
jgi:hypothetical protein